MTYPALVLANAVVQAFATAADDTRISLREGGEETRSLSLKQLVTGDLLAAKPFVMGLPAMTLALVGNLVAPLMG